MEGDNRPSPENPKFVIGRYEFRKPWNEEDRKAGLLELGRDDTWNRLYFDSIEDAKRVLAMTHNDKEAWYIAKCTDSDGYVRSSDVIMQHPRITQIEEEREARRNKVNAEEQAEAVAINASPKTMVVKIGKAKFLFERSDAEYNPGRSAVIRTGASLKVQVGDNTRYFWFDNWIRKDGIIQKKKFQDDMGRFFGEDTEAVMLRLKDLQDLKNRFGRGKLTDEELASYEVHFANEVAKELPAGRIVKESIMLPSKKETVLRAGFAKRPGHSEVSGR